VFDNTKLKIFGHDRKMVIEEWRKLHDEKLHETYSSPNTTRVVE
jgi:hypothetical protein